MNNQKMEKLLTEVLDELRASTKEVERSNQLLQDLCCAVKYQAQEQKKEFVSSVEAGEMLSKSKYAILRWIKSGKLDAVCINRRYFITKSSLSRFLRHG